MIRIRFIILLLTLHIQDKTEDDEKHDGDDKKHVSKSEKSVVNV